MGVIFMNKDKITLLAVELNKLTSKNQISWEAITPPPFLTEASDDFIPILYRCLYKSKQLALFIRRYKHFYDEHDYYWNERVVFAILNRESRIIWESPEASQALRDLYETVSNQSAGVDDLLDDLLGKN